VILLQGIVTRWVADDPQPGLVQIEITDADGRVHRLEEKPAVVDADGRLQARSRYPVEVEIACQPRHQQYRPREERIVNVVDLSPWGVDDETVLYPVARSQLTWTTPAVYPDLSVRARQAVALVTFRRWRRAVGLGCVELVALEDHLWEFATVIPDAFDAWYQSHPLTQLNENDPLPRTIRDAVASRGIDQGGMRRAIKALIEITYGGLFGGIQSEWSLNELETVGQFTARYGIPLAPAENFVESLWIDNNWGKPEDHHVRHWRGSQ
jgi:hypothetical protein